MLANNSTLDKNQKFEGLLNTDSEPILISKCPCDIPVRVGAYGGQMINEVLAPY